MIKLVPKLWGHEEWLVNNDKYCAKYLILKYGYQCSLHYHKKKDETFYVLEGLVNLEIYDDMNDRILTYPLRPGDSYRIKPNLSHRFYTKTPEAKLLEVSTTHYDEDSYRLEISRKRSEDTYGKNSRENT
jgi:mannose-6-phosphate isomerase-like protein (cupin superfamily)